MIDLTISVVIGVNEVAYEGGGQDRECVVSACAHLIHKLHYSKAFSLLSNHHNIVYIQYGTACNRIQ